MSAATIAGAIAAEQGWNDNTLLCLCLDYINNQQSNEAFEDHLRQSCAPTDEERMKDTILNYVRERQGVSFAELSKDIPGFRGERTLRHTPHKNLFVWFDLSEEAVSALTELLDEERITVKVTDPLIYICDGMIPQFPVAKKLRGYTTPHWLPVSISTP